MDKMQWVNDKEAKFYFSDWRNTGVCFIGYVDRKEASESLLEAMENDTMLVGILLFAAAAYVAKNSNRQQNFLEVIKAINGK